MTTTNSGRVVEHVDGIVQGANERGVHLQGEQDWRNFSKYADPIASPVRGQSVRLGLDASGFVRELELLGAAAESSPAPLAARDHTINRLTVLKAAANFLGAMSQTHEEVRSDHVLVLADRWVKWVNGEGGD